MARGMKKTPRSYKSTKKVIAPRGTARARGKWAIRDSGTKLGLSIGFPKTLKFKHKYVEQFLLTDASTIQNYQFSCNGMYDPNITGTGHQPMYFDQLGALYDHYTVIGSKIKYRVVPSGTAIQNPYKIITWINDDTTSTGDATSFSENKFAKTRLCTGGVNPSQIILTNKWSAKKFFGGSVMANDELKGTTSANPAEQSYFQISFRTLDGTSTVSVYVLVEIEYVAIWKELKELASS